MHVDWITFTINSEPGYPSQCEGFIRDLGLDPLLTIPSSRLRAWRPFNEGYGNELYRVQWRGFSGWSSLSITGHGCAEIRPLIPALLGEWAGNITRLDIAHDCPPEHNPSPLEWSKVITARTKSVIQSDNGETLYVGSRTSAAYMRIYRYKDPNPRAGITRVELELKEHYAKHASHLIATEGMDGIAAYMARKSNSVGWVLWEGKSEGKPPVMGAGKRPGAEDGWVRWLHTAAMPAVRKAVMMGVINEGDVFPHLRTKGKS